jgi:Protein of unknown function (DUF3800)
LWSAPQRPRYWRLLVLRLFVDDSGSGGDSPWFVLSGLTSTVGKWAEFTDEWDHQLRANPKIDYLKMSEAESLKKQFEGFSVPERDAKVLALARIVRRHVLYKTHLLIDHPAFDSILRPKIPKKPQSPYVFAFQRDDLGDCIV